MITRIVRFCSENCKNKFEMNIYEICDICNVKYDKSKGEYIYQNKHFHSKKTSVFIKSPICLWI